MTFQQSCQGVVLAAVVITVLVWIGPVESQVVYCHPFPTWYDINQTTYSSNKEIPLGSHVTYYCRDGYNFEDGAQSKTSTCAQNRTWSPSFEKCSAPETEDDDTPKEAPNSKLIGIFTWLFVCFEMLLFFLLDSQNLYLFYVKTCGRKSELRKKMEMKEYIKKHRGLLKKGGRGWAKVRMIGANLKHMKKNRAGGPGAGGHTDAEDPLKTSY